MHTNDYVDFDDETEDPPLQPRRLDTRHAYAHATMILVVLIVGGSLFGLARMAIYKIRPYERGLHYEAGHSSASTSLAGISRSPLRTPSSSCL